MLNTSSAYFKDQLLEKLQLMMATRELYILRIDRQSLEDKHVHTVIFQVAATEEEWKVQYDSHFNLVNLPKALTLLAEDMHTTMRSLLTSRLVQAD